MGRSLRSNSIKEQHHEQQQASECAAFSEKGTKYSYPAAAIIKQEPALSIVDESYVADDENLRGPEESPLSAPEKVLILGEISPVERCAQWILQQQQVMELETEVESTRLPEDDDMLNVDGSRTLPDEPAKLSSLMDIDLRARLKRFSEKEILNSVMYECEWLKCKFETVMDMEYINHVDGHAVKYLKDHEGQEELTCFWDLCDFKTSDGSLFISHVHFHSYHNRLKTHGASLSSIIQIPKCNNDSRRRNTIDQYRISFVCEWGECTEPFVKAQPFFAHVNEHVRDQFPVNKKSSKTQLTCEWIGCKQVYTRRSLALDHVKSHTTERYIGCYTCGTMLTCRSNYLSHCQRQVEYQNREHACPECGKLYATKQLLIDHRNIHVKRFHCEMCPLAFPSRKALAYHYRYRHITERPFQCQMCNHRCVTKTDLETHIITHESGKMFNCEEFGCTASYRSQKSLKRHVDLVHYGSNRDVYACHLCPTQFKISSLLSKHLLKIHRLSRPQGYRRFTYRADMMGVFRLATNYNYTNSGQPQQSSSTAEAHSQGEKHTKPAVKSSNSSTSKRKASTKAAATVAIASSGPEQESQKPCIKIDRIEPTGPNAFTIELKVEDQPSVPPIQVLSDTSLAGTTGGAGAAHQQQQQAVLWPISKQEIMSEVESDAGDGIGGGGVGRGALSSRSMMELEEDLAASESSAIVRKANAMASVAAMEEDYEYDYDHEDDSSATSAIVKVDNFEVMKRYIKKERPIYISYEEMGSDGRVIRQETLEVTELSEEQHQQQLQQQQQVV